MRTLLMKKAASYLATASLAICPFVSSVTATVPSQPAFITTVTPPIKAETTLTNDPVVVRNTTTKTEAHTATAPAKVQGKQTIGRCWKRLMNMAREVTHAHSAKK